MNSKRNAGVKKKLLAMFRLTIILLVTLCFLFPFYISFSYSFKTASDIGKNSLALPTKLYFGNYIDVLTKNKAFQVGIVNSTITTVIIVPLLTIFCSMAAYVLARNRNKFYSVVYYLFMTGILIPFQCIMLPTYINLRAMGLMNTLAGFIIVRTGFQIGICMLTITSFVKSVPRELDEAAVVDGANPFKVFWKIVFPLMKPINFTMLVINALFAWNDFYVSLTILQSPEKRTLPLAQFVYLGDGGDDNNRAFAFFSLSMIPVLAIYLFAQKHIVRGIMSGAVKG